MIVGLVIFVMGLVILLYPQVLVAMIASFFMVSGAVIMGMSLRWRRVKQDAQNSAVNWFLRF